MHYFYYFVVFMFVSILLMLSVHDMPDVNQIKQPMSAAVTALGMVV